MSDIRRRPATLLAAAALGFGALVFAFLPSSVVVLGTDFGYLKSVIYTLQRHRPWTDDFLEPWSASHSLLSAWAFRLTGNFYAATYGLNALYAALSFVALGLLLRARAFSNAGAIALAGTILTFPVLFWSELDFTCMALYIPSLLWAIWAAENKRWWLFSLAWLCAVSSRQSAVAWLAWPATELVAGLFDRQAREHRRRWIKPSIVLGVGVVALGVLQKSMNVTHAQREMLMHTVSMLSATSAARSLAVGLLVCGLAIGLAASTRVLSATPLARRPAPARFMFIGWLLVGALVLCVDLPTLTIVDRIPVNSWPTWCYAKLVMALALAGWMVSRFRLSPGPLLSALASISLISLRPGVWDYYLLDAALLGFFAAAEIDSGEKTVSTAPTSPAPWVRRAVVVALSFAMLYHAWTGYFLKVALDDGRAQDIVYERAMRASRLGPLEIASAPFGYKGWHLYDYRVVDQHNRRWLTDSLFPSVATVRLEIDYPDAFPRYCRRPHGAKGPEENTPIANETFRIGWFWQCRYQLFRIGSDTTISSPPIRHSIFPLNNAEWLALIDGTDLGPRH